MLGFPSNQFGAQQPGSPEEIAAFRSTRCGVTCPLYAKVDVNGEQAQPLYRRLNANSPGSDGGAEIRWNFGKFLVVGRVGRVIARFDPKQTPESLVPDIEAALARARVAPRADVRATPRR